MYLGECDVDSFGVGGVRRKVPDFDMELAGLAFAHRLQRELDAAAARACEAQGSGFRG
jgi:hypothetical protein